MIKEFKNLLNNTLIIGSKTHEKADRIKWTQPFPNLEEYDSIIIDLTSFPKNYPPNLFSNIAILKRTARIFISNYKEIFCIMEKPLKILFKQIPLNYSWVPFPQKLTVDPMLLGKTIILTDTRFSDYIKNVEKWDNELNWINTTNCSFDPIAINKTNKPIAATITMNQRGKIHFLPKATKISHSQAIEHLIDLAHKKETKEYPWEKTIEIPEIKQNNNLWNSNISKENYRNLFSKEHKKIVNAVQLILEDLGIVTIPTSIHDLKDSKNNMVVHITSVKEKVEIQNPKINQLAQFIENKTKKPKIIFIANTYHNLPLETRTNKEHLDLSTRIFLETNNIIFLTTSSLFHLWKKVITNQVSTKEVHSLIQNKSGETTI